MSGDRVADPLWALDAAQLASAYRTGRFTPLDALAAVHDRIDARNPGLNAVIAEDRAAARETARRCGERWRAGRPLSALDGVPLTVKDNLHVAGLPATWGSRAYAACRPTEDELAIARLRQAGAVILGKTNVPEFTVQGYTANALFGTTRNPLTLDRTPGGSTGGGAAAVAAGFGPLAIGTDGGGSLRRPAAHCGLFALKPSIGQIARRGGFRQILADFEVIGPIGRTLQDVRAAFDVMRGDDAREPRSAAARAPSRGVPSRPRVGYFAGVGAAPVDPRIAAASDAFAAALADAAAEITPIAAPFDLDATHTVWGTIASAGLAWEIGHLGDAKSLLGTNARSMGDRGARVTLAEYLDALADVAVMRAAAADVFSRFDLLLCPSTAALAWDADEPYPTSIDDQPVGPRGHAIFTGWMNVTGLCAVNVPVASTVEAGGIGVQIVAAPGRDLDLLDFLLTAPAIDRVISPGASAKGRRP